MKGEHSKKTLTLKDLPLLLQHFLIPHPAHPSEQRMSVCVLISRLLVMCCRAVPVCGECFIAPHTHYCVCPHSHQPARAPMGTCAWTLKYTVHTSTLVNIAWLPVVVGSGYRASEAHGGLGTTSKSCGRTKRHYVETISSAYTLILGQNRTGQSGSLLSIPSGTNRDQWTVIPRVNIRVVA